MARVPVPGRRPVPNPAAEPRAGRGPLVGQGQGRGREGGEGYDQRPGTAGIGTDKCPGSVDGVCTMGWVAADIQAAANNDFLAANPAVEKMLELFAMDVVEVSLMNVEMGDGADVEDLAAPWIEDNRDLVDSWIAEAMAAA